MQNKNHTVYGDIPPLRNNDGNVIDENGNVIPESQVEYKGVRSEPLFKDEPYDFSLITPEDIKEGVEIPGAQKTGALASGIRGLLGGGLKYAGEALQDWGTSDEVKGSAGELLNRNKNPVLSYLESTARDVGLGLSSLGENHIEQANLYRPKIESYKEIGEEGFIDGVGDTLDYAKGLAVQSAPYMAWLALGAATKSPVPLATVATSNAGQTVYEQEQRGEDKSLLRAGVTGTGEALLESVLPAGLTRTFKPAVSKFSQQALKNYLGKEGVKKGLNFAKNSIPGAIAKGAVIEGATEGAQDVLRSVGVHGKPSLENIDESVVGGGVLGGLFAGGGRAGARLYNKYSENKVAKEDAIRQAQADAYMQQHMPDTDIHALPFHPNSASMNAYYDVRQREAEIGAKVSAEINRITKEQYEKENAPYPKVAEQRTKLINEQLKKAQESSRGLPYRPEVPSLAQSPLLDQATELKHKLVEEKKQADAKAFEKKYGHYRKLAEAKAKQLKIDEDNKVWKDRAERITQSLVNRDNKIKADAEKLNYALPHIKVKSNGKPFASEKQVKLSKAFKETPHPKIVPVDGGYGVIDTTVNEKDITTRAKQNVGVSNVSSSAKNLNSHRVIFSKAKAKHTKTGDDIYVAKLEEQLPKPEFYKLKSKVKQFNGHYSNFKGKGAVPGFHFRSEGDRDNFIHSLVPDDNVRKGSLVSESIADAIYREPHFKESVSVIDNGTKTSQKLIAQDNPLSYDYSLNKAAYIDYLARSIINNSHLSSPEYLQSAVQSGHLDEAIKGKIFTHKNKASLNHPAFLNRKNDIETYKKKVALDKSISDKEIGEKIASILINPGVPFTKSITNPETPGAIDYLFGNDYADYNQSVNSDSRLSEGTSNKSQGGKHESSKLGKSGKGALERVSANDVQRAETSREIGTSATGSRREDVSGNRQSGAVRVPASRSVGNDEREVSDTAGRGGAGRRGRGSERRRQTVQGRSEAAQRGTTETITEPSVNTSSARELSTLPSSAMFTITQETGIGEGGAKTKFKNNLQAISTLKTLQNEKRQASIAEQAILAKYVGWGGLPQAFYKDDGSVSSGWNTEAAKLKELLTSDEYSAARRSTQDSHYTSYEIVSSIWQAIKGMGFNGGKVIEPSVGTGNFFGIMPGELRSNSELTGVELDPITGGIAKHLYPKANIQSPVGYQDFTTPDNYFDLAIGNPPFGSQKLYDSKRKHLSFSIHNYFFAKSIDILKPNGILAMVVSSRLMDSHNSRARDYLRKRTELLGAIRLPNNAFMKNAGTEVTTDIIFLRKLAEGEGFTGVNWTAVKEVTDKNGITIPLNEYFVKRSEMMLGEWGAYGSMYGPDEPALVARDGQDTPALLQEALQKIKKADFSNIKETVEDKTITAIDDISSIKIGSMYIGSDNEIHIRKEDHLGKTQSEPVTLNNKRAGIRIRGLIDIRDIVAKLRSAQLDETATDKDIEALRRELNETYDLFVKKQGYINSYANKRLFMDDPSWPQLSALEEDYDKGISKQIARNTGEKPRKPSAKKAAVFRVRTQRPYEKITTVHSAKDALSTSLLEYGRVNIDAMEKLYNRPAQEILKELDSLIFEASPGEWQTSEEYLSGNVKEKLKYAEALAAGDERFQRNVEALKAVQPKDIDSTDIDIKLGSHWVPKEIMTEFTNHVLSSDSGKAIYSPHTANWYFKGFASESAHARFGTSRVSVTDIMESVANQKRKLVYDETPEGTRVVNNEETQAVSEKGEKIKAEFKRWLWQSDSRREELARIYNASFNTDVERIYDGSHLTFPGKVEDNIVKLRPHQANAVWRVMQSGTTLLDHVVGSGKTYTMISAAMELRRIGRADKPMFVVPNHLIGQWATEFVRLYPSANILAATKKDFEKKNRKRLFARITTGDWDAIIVAHSSFGKVEVDRAYKERFIKDQIIDVDKSIETLRKQDGKKARSVKQSEKHKDRLKEKLKRLYDNDGKDDNVTFGELGVDALFVDEAHEFKNLEFSTSMTRVAGLGNPQGSGKASDLFMKVRYILDKTGGKNVVFATGTPISNTMAEMFTMQRYLDYNALENQNLSHFDAWAKMYGEVVNDWELSPSGKYKLNNRFSKFVNMPELMQRYLSFADVINREDINRQLAASGRKLPVPKMKSGKPINIVVERSQHQADYIGEPVTDERGNEVYEEGTLIYRAENLPKKAEKGADNMLKIMGDARKAALDMRLIDAAYPDYAGSKVNRAVKEIKRIYDAWNKDLGTQLVFIDMSTPKGSKAKEAARIRDLIDRADAGDDKAAEQLDKMSPDELSALESNFSVYDDLRQKLIHKGIPESDIAFIHDANTDIQKEELFGKVRSGRIRVLLGSTAKMGAGMNVQERLVALHHIDAPWRPSDLEQREGRIIRQGNKLYAKDPGGFEVEILRYATKNTLDARMWQTLEFKAKFIEQIRKGDSSSRVIDDVGNEASNAAEMKAASSGNPLILEEMELRQKVSKLEQSEAGHHREQYNIRRKIRQLGDDIERYGRELSRLSNDILRVPEKGKYSVTIKGKAYSKHKDIGKAILDSARALLKANGDSKAIGTVSDFELLLDKIDGRNFIVTAKGDSEHQVEIKGVESSDPSGLSLRLFNVLNAIAGKIKHTEQKLAQAEKDIPDLKSQQREWPHLAELEKAKERHSEVIAELKPKSNPNQDTQEQEDKKYSLRNNKAKGIKASRISYGLRQLEGELSVYVSVKQSESQLPDHIVSDITSRAHSGKVRGVYDAAINHVYIVADNLDSVNEARQVYLHEVLGHHGLRKIKGLDLDSVLEGIYKGMPDSAKRDIRNKDSLTDSKDIAEEYVAHLAETNHKHNLVKRIVYKLKAWLRKYIPSIKWRYDDVVHLIALSRKALHSKANQSSLKERKSYVVEADSLLKKGKYRYLRNAGRAYARKYFMNKAFYNDDMEQDIYFYGRGINHIYSGKVEPVLVQLTPYFPHIIKQAKVLDYSSDYKADSGAFARITQLSLPLDIQGKEYFIDLTVKEHINDGKNKLYDLSATKGDVIEEGDTDVQPVARLVITDASVRDTSAPSTSIDQRKTDKFDTRDDSRKYSLSDRKLGVVKVDTTLLGEGSNDVLRKKAEVFAKSHFKQGVYRNKDSGFDIRFSMRGIRKTLRGAGRDLILTVPATRAFIEQAAYAGSSEPENQKKGRFRLYHYFEVNADIDGREKGVWIVVGESNDGKYYYSHSLKKESEGNGDVGSRPRLLKRTPGGVDTAPVRMGASPSPVSIDQRKAEKFDADDKPKYSLKQGDKTLFSWQQAEDQAIVRKTRQALKTGNSRLRDMLLKVMTIRQIEESFRHIFNDYKHNPLTGFKEKLQAMMASRTRMIGEAEEIDIRWGKLWVSGESARLSDLMHQATIAEYDPDRQKGGNRKLDYQWKQLSEEARNVYRDVRDYYSTQWRRTHQALIARIERTVPKGEAKNELIKRINAQFLKARNKSPYFPLGRFGDYFVVAMDPEGNPYRAHFETVGKMDEGKTRLEREGFTVTDYGRRPEFTSRKLEGISGFADQIHTLIKSDKVKMEKGQKDMLHDEINQIALRMLPDVSAAKAMIHRKKTPGFEKNARRVFSNHAIHSASRISRLNYSDRMSNELDTMGDITEDSQISHNNRDAAIAVQNILEKQYQAILNPQGSAWAANLTNLGFLYYLGGSIGAGIVNLTQTPLVTFPMLCARYGFGKASKELSKAYADFMAHGDKKLSLRESAISLSRAESGLSKNEKIMLEELVNDGTIDTTQAHTIAQIADTDMKLDKQDFTGWKSNVSRAVGFFFHNAEVANREVSALAAYRLAASKGLSHEKATNEAREMVFNSHFDYSGHNRGLLLKSNLAKVAFLFKTYSQHMVYTLWRNTLDVFSSRLTKDERVEAGKRLGGILGMHALFAGVTGLPLVSPILWMISSVASLLSDDDDIDAEKEMMNGIYAMAAALFGKENAQLVTTLISKGTFNATGFDMHSRVSLDELIIRNPDSDMTSRQEATWLLEQLAGPIYGMGLKAWSFPETWDKSPQRAVENVLPKFARDMLKSKRYMEDGAVGYNGDVIQKDFSPAELASQFIGIAPSSLAEKYDLRRMIKSADSRMMKKRRRLMDKFYQAWREQDRQAMSSLLEAMKQWTQRNPEYGFSSRGLRQSLKSRVASDNLTHDGIYLPKKRQSLMKEYHWSQ